MPVGLAVDKVGEVVTAVSGAPVTFDRKPPKDLDIKLANPGLPRANIAPCVEKPDSEVSPLPSCEQKSVLQQHIRFFDRNNDGIIYPWETYAGWVPHPLFPIYVKNAHKLKHGSDSEVYGKLLLLLFRHFRPNIQHTEGRFVPEKFEEIFSKFDKDGKNALTLPELWKLTEALRNANDPYGWFAAKSEWIVLYFTVAGKDKMVSKEKIRSQYDGSLWFAIEQDIKSKKKKEV
ncbi:hypothetical protein HDU67_001754 [Dinochytrium kinnereticum]|nr:hypothetical protein HDU67_001754 [Dinochytrium kinnereticum]